MPFQISAIALHEVIFWGIGAGIKKYPGYNEKNADESHVSLVKKVPDLLT